MTLKEKYPDSSYDPNPNCKFCKGVGERHKVINSTQSKTYACACLFLDPAYCEEVAIEIGHISTRLKKEL